MKKSLVFLFLLIPSLIFSQNQNKVTYISNEGFLIENNDKKVLIDGLFSKIDVDWCDSPSDSIVDLLRMAKHPFDDIDIIAITHRHLDHFNESIVVDHMINNPKAIVICPNQVRDTLAGNEKYNKIVDRIISISPEFLSDSNIVVSNVPIRVFRFEHSHYIKMDKESGKKYNKHENVENIGFLINLNGTKVFHSGDTNPLNEEEYLTYGLSNENIDIAFVERLFFGVYGGEGIEMINKLINPDHIILMHIRPANKRIFIENFGILQNVTVFENKMDSKIFNIAE